MYGLFTDRSRKVLHLANQEAQRFNHEYVGTEHILLGLIKEGSGVAVNVLKNLDMNLEKLRIEVEKVVPAGPDMTMGKLPHTPLAKRVIEYSMEEARTFNHNYVGTEHLLLGLLKVKEGVAVQVLTNLGITTELVREEVLNILGHGTDSDSDNAADATVVTWNMPCSNNDNDTLAQLESTLAQLESIIKKKDIPISSHLLIRKVLEDIQHILNGLSES